jgi:hypothetical protein
MKTQPKIVFEHTRLSGNWVAKCTDCNFVSVYWEEAEELEHDCKEHNTKEKGK